MNGIKEAIAVLEKQRAKYDKELDHLEAQAKGIVARMETLKSKHAAVSLVLSQLREPPLVDAKASQ